MNQDKESKIYFPDVAHNRSDKTVCFVVSLQVVTSFESGFAFITFKRIHINIHLIHIQSSF